MARALRILLVIALCGATLGCSKAMVRVVTAIAVRVVVAAIREGISHERRNRREAEQGPPPTAYLSPVDARSSEGPPRPSSVYLEPVVKSQVQDAVDTIDLSPCRDGETPKGRARITMSPDGTAVKAFVDEPIEMSGRTRACIAERLMTARVMPFEGRAGIATVDWTLD